MVICQVSLKKERATRDNAPPFSEDIHRNLSKRALTLTYSSTLEESIQQAQWIHIQIFYKSLIHPNTLSLAASVLPSRSEAEVLLSCRETSGIILPNGNLFV